MKNHIFAILLLSTPVISDAGQYWPVECQNTNCNFKGEMDCGGGFRFGQVSGFCTTCRKIVTLSWSHPETPTYIASSSSSDASATNTPPKNIGSIWNPATGTFSDLYACPYCHKPFAEFDPFSLAKVYQDGMVFCPMCSNLTLKVKMYGNYD